MTTTGPEQGGSRFGDGDEGTRPVGLPDEPGHLGESVELIEPPVVVEPFGAEAGFGPAPATVAGDAGPVLATGVLDEPAGPSTVDNGSAVGQVRDRGRAALVVLGELARQRPAAFLAGAAVAGAVAGRVLGRRRDQE